MPTDPTQKSPRKLFLLFDESRKNVREQGIRQIFQYPNPNNETQKIQRREQLNIRLKISAAANLNERQAAFAIPRTSRTAVIAISYHRVQSLP